MDQGNEETATLTELWYAATAILTMCVRRGFAGMSSGLGELIILIQLYSLTLRF